MLPRIPVMDDSGMKRLSLLEKKSLGPVCGCIPKLHACHAAFFVVIIPDMTKKDLFENVSSCCDIPRKEAEQAVESVLDIIKETLASGEELKVSGFGKFAVHLKRDRKGRNPQTGEPITISARKILTFKPSTVLKQDINTN